jgi:dipeptidyl-peptidase-4
LHQNSSAPPLYTLYKKKGNKEVRVLQDNKALQGRLDGFNLSQKEFFMAKVGDQELSAWIIKPTDFDASKEYPVLMHVYGGPGSQTVEDSYDGFNDKWYQMLADKGYIIASVDNRGTGARGRDFRKCTYRELGKLETEDQIGFAQYLGKQDYVDASRIGIWGWSYGGYMSSLCISKGAEVFDLAIAVAPVTNWRFYDNIYTERYMGLPQDNASGYDNNSPINHVDKIKGDYMLIHGSADDNVHVQNSMRMTEALVQNDIPFRQFIYPDKNHGIYGGNTRYHLYKMMTEFILENL